MVALPPPDLVRSLLHIWNLHIVLLSGKSLDDEGLSDAMSHYHDFWLGPVWIV